jgi:hypothetical protein
MGRPVLRTPPRRAVAAALTAALALASAAACSDGAQRPAADRSDTGQPATASSALSSTLSSAPTSAASSAPTTAGSTTANSTTGTPVTAQPALPVRPTVSGSGIWQPPPGLTWQWQLTEPVDTSVDAQVYDIDGQENSAKVVSGLHALGRKVICYVDVGSYENYRPDAARFPASVRGLSNGWPGEDWLDIRQIGVLEPIMAARIEVCRQKGFDAVEADNVDGYENDTGFPLTAAEQLAYDEMIAGLAHADGLAIGLKNDLDQVPQLLPHFDFAIDEQCAEYSECSALEPFVRARKAVFEAEYNLPLSGFCGQAASLGFSAILKDTALDATRQACSST